MLYYEVGDSSLFGKIGSGGIGVALEGVKQAIALGWEGGGGYTTIGMGGPLP